MSTIRQVSISDATHGYRCDSCGNRTRFDFFETKKSRVFRHYSLGGAVTEEEEEIIEYHVERIVCRWCGSVDAVRVAEASDVAAGPAE
jgi:DNA-directed RNA polymerase subunit RPC12/RpoP